MRVLGLCVTAKKNGDRDSKNCFFGEIVIC
jgi:hypothetical protein